MPTLLRLLLLSAFVTTGVSLECEACGAFGSKCAGGTMTCDPGQKNCIISMVYNSLLGSVDPFSLISRDNKNPEVDSRIDESVQIPADLFFGEPMQTIEKGCEVIPICEYGDIYINIGQNRTLRSSHFCCKGADCQKISPKLPPIHTAPNGKECPACLKVSRGCPKETVKCVGPEIYCFSVNIKAKIAALGILKVKGTLMGCTSKSFCDMFQTSKTDGLLGFDVENLQCSAASKRPGASGVPFLILLGLLLMKVLV